MNLTATIISEGCLQDLYLQRHPFKKDPVLQILAYQISESNPKEIILRISDKSSFLDCVLVGPYTISAAQIISTQYSRSSQSFKRYDIVKVVDYFCKIDASKICQLKIIIRKLEEVQTNNQIVGHPEEISQFIENRYQNATNKQYTKADAAHLLNLGSMQTPIKLEDIENQPSFTLTDQSKNRNVHEPVNQNPNNLSNKDEDPLCLADIMNNKPGFFIGRLVRTKFGCKDAKDGPMSFLYLGFIDRNGDLVRIHLAGRVAIKQSKDLKKGKCYYIKGIQLFQGQKMKGQQYIRLKQKQYKIHQITNQTIKSQYKHQYFQWQHEQIWSQSDMVDVVGIVEDIEDKITYRNANTFQQQRDVVRLVIRNIFKTARVSFWADNINVLKGLNLQRKQPILIQDIKKKKTIFLDYVAQSNIIMLQQSPQLKQQLQQFLPPLEEMPDPTNIQQYLQICQIEPFNTKIRQLNMIVASINPKWIIYKMCHDCKKKVEKILNNCPECQKTQFSFRYNCPIDFTDSSGFLNCVAFDAVCEKLFGRSANEFNTMVQQQVRELLQSIIYGEFKVSIQNKNSRLIIRTLQRVNNQQLMESGLHQLVGVQEVNE